MTLGLERPSLAEESDASNIDILAELRPQRIIEECPYDPNNEQLRALSELIATDITLLSRRDTGNGTNDARSTCRTKHCQKRTVWRENDSNRKEHRWAAIYLNDRSDAC